MAETLRPIVAAARAGDRDALNALAGCADRFVRIFHGSLSQTVRLGYGSTVDFVLEGIAEALNKLEGFEYRSDEEFYGWISRFIENRIRGAGRAANSQKRGDRPQPLAVLGDVVPDKGKSVAAIVQTRDLRDAVGNSILEVQASHPREMEVVVRKIFDEETWPQIRAALELSSDKRARTLFVKGLERLRSLVEERLGTQSFEQLLGL